MFRCTVSGDPTPQVEWSKGKWRKLTGDGRTRVYEDGAGHQVLELDGVGPKDAATYTVRIWNKFSEATCSATLIVTDKEEEAQDWKAQLKKMSVDCRGGVAGGVWVRGCGGGRVWEGVWVGPARPL